MSTPRNSVGWFEIYVADMDRAKAFYEKTFGDTLTRLWDPTESPIDMWAFPMHDDAPGACGALCKMEGMEPGGGGILIYFSCEDCGKTEAAAAEAGAKVIKEKSSIGEYGFISIIIDTEGNTIGLHSQK